MRSVICALIVTLTGVAILGSALASDQKQEVPTPNAGSAATQLDLPDDLRGKLIGEMKMVVKRMGVLLRHLSTGDAQKAGTTAGTIRDTFILKKGLTQEERERFDSLIPKDFVKREQAFQGELEKLLADLETEDFSSAIQRFAAMGQACLACHATFATERFPGLAGK